MELKRHYVGLSEQETEELIVAVADLLVNFLKGNRESVPPSSAVVAAARPEIQS
jgi:hypothetical protein